MNILESTWLMPYRFSDGIGLTPLYALLRAKQMDRCSFVSCRCNAAVLGISIACLLFVFGTTSLHAEGGWTRIGGDSSFADTKTTNRLSAFRPSLDGWQSVGSVPSLNSKAERSALDSGKLPPSPQPSPEVSVATYPPTGGGASAEGWFSTSRQTQERNVVPDAVLLPQLDVSSADHTSDLASGNRASNGDSTQTTSFKSAPTSISLEDPQSDVQQVKARQVATVRPALTDNVITQNLDLFLGEVKVIDNVDVSRVAVGRGGILTAEVLDTGELLIIATAAGSSSIRLWNNDNTQSDYNVRVSETDPQTRVHMQSIVRMRVRMVEFRKSALGRLGIDWGESVGGPTLAATASTVSSSFNSAAAGINAPSALTAPFSTFFGIASNITSSINFLAQNGDAVTLAEPVLTAMNGSTASFLAGGEVPYPVVGQDGQTQIEFKEYGVKLNVAPLIDSVGNVRAMVETEISQLDKSVSINGTPGLLTRRAQTEVTVNSGDTIVISGLLSTESSADVNMIPGLGKLPVIGRFFSSETRSNAASELVIFVTPEVIVPHEKVINTREQQYFNQSDQRLSEARHQLPLME